MGEDSREHGATLRGGFSLANACERGRSRHGLWRERLTRSVTSQYVPGLVRLPKCSGIRRSPGSQQANESLESPRHDNLEQHRDRIQGSQRLSMGHKRHNLRFQLPQHILQTHSKTAALKSAQPHQSGSWSSAPLFRRWSPLNREVSTARSTVSTRAKTSSLPHGNAAAPTAPNLSSSTTRIRELVSRVENPMIGQAPGGPTAGTRATSTCSNCGCSTRRRMGLQRRRPRRSEHQHHRRERIAGSASTPTPQSHSGVFLLGR